MCPLQLSLRVATVHIKVRIGSLDRVFCYLSEMHQGTRKETSHDHLSSIIIDMFMIGSQYGLLFF